MLFVGKTKLNRLVDGRIERAMGTLTSKSSDGKGISYTEEMQSIFKAVIEGYVWYSSNEHKLSHFYKLVLPQTVQTDSPNDDLNYFWKVASREVRKVNTGLATRISDTMADILFANGFKITGLNDSDLVRLNLILKDNNIMDFVLKSATTESWAGFVGAKIIVDTNVSEFPILEMVEPENITIQTKYSRILAHRLKVAVLERMKTRVVVYETRVNTRGVTEIIYEFFKDTGQKEVQVPIEEANLLPDEIELYQDVVIPNMSTPLAFFKANKLPNNNVRSSLFGKGDYATMFTELDMLDEINSLWAEDGRNSRTIFGVPQALVPKDLNGRNERYNRLLNNSIETKAVRDADGNKDLSITKINPEVDINKFLDTEIELTEKILRSAGLSPVTMGFEGGLGANASAEARREMEKLTIKTHGAKSKIWEPYLQDIFVGLLQAEDFMNSRSAKQYEVNVVINPYIDTTIEERMTKAIEIHSAGLMSLEKAIEFMYRDNLTEEEKQEEIDRLLGTAEPEPEETEPTVPTEDIEEDEEPEPTEPIEEDEENV